MASGSPESLVLRRQSARIQRRIRVPDYVDNGCSPIRKRKYSNVRTPLKKELKPTTMKKEELIVAEKEILAQRRVELLDEERKMMKKVSPLKRRRVDAESVQTEEENGAVIRPESAKKENVAKADDSVKAENESVSLVGNVGEKSDYAKVKETLRVFNKHYLYFVQVFGVLAHLITRLLDSALCAKIVLNLVSRLIGRGEEMQKRGSRQEIFKKFGKK